MSAEPAPTPSPAPSPAPPAPATPDVGGGFSFGKAALIGLSVILSILIVAFAIELIKPGSIYSRITKKEEK